MQSDDLIRNDDLPLALAGAVDDDYLHQVGEALAPVIPTNVFATYWRFAAERQEMFFRRVERQPAPWTSDKVLAAFRFTNSYRASDRASQHLIRSVIYEGDQSPNELFFRILLFKIFNRISTWNLLADRFGPLRCDAFEYERCDDALTSALARGERIFSPAYIMPSGSAQFKHPRKHTCYLQLLRMMISDDLPRRLVDVKSLRAAYELVRSYPMLGDFLAFQFTIDLNYSTLLDFSEDDFVVAGPGARSGIRKCFSCTGGLGDGDIIRMMVDRQDEEFARMRIDFKDLWGRRLHLIDCQNLFCEVDKYARIAHPDIQGRGHRVRIKRRYKPGSESIAYWYPPKWRINTVPESRCG